MQALPKEWGHDFVAGLYKGFIATDGKQPMEKYKGLNSFRSYADVQELPSFAGVLRDDCIMVDVDDAESAEKLMTIVEDLQIRCRVTCTSRGKHFTFRNSGVEKCGTGLKLACGLVADIKTGGMPEVLKVDGEERFCEWGDENPEAGEYDELPIWMHPVTTKMDFLSMEAGTGRNSGLFGYILVLQTQLGMSSDQCRECIKIINDYVLPEPLDDSELEVILRDDSFSKELFYEGKTFFHNRFGDYLKAKHHIKRINNQLHVYRDGVYVAGHRYLENMMVRDIPTLKYSLRTEVIRYLEALIPENESTGTHENLIAFRNGVLDINTGSLHPFHPDFIITNKIPWDYNPAAECQLVDQTLDKIACRDPEIRSLLEECIGYCFYRKNNLQKSFILTGVGSNGKSTFLEMLKYLLGDSNISQLDIAELDDRFSTVMLAGKLANIGDDISSDFIQGKTVSFFKKAVTGNGLKAENKGQDVFFFKPYTKLLFSANEIPRMKNKGFEAIRRRLLIVPFRAKFSKDDPDYDYQIEDKLKTQTAMEYLILLGIAGLKRALKNRGFTESSKVQAELDAFERDNNPILSWLEAMNEEEGSDIVTDHIIRIPLQEMYSSYEMYCCNNGFRPTASNEFSKQLQQMFNLSSVRKKHNGKQYTMLKRC